MRLRSTAPALLLQSPVQRAGRVIGFPDAERRAAARNGWQGHSSLFITLICSLLSHYSHLFITLLCLYKTYRAALYRIRIESFGAGDAHIAARCATVAPQGEIQTLGEHGSLCRRFGRHARHGAPFYVFGAVLKLGASARIWRCSCARCLWLNGTLPASLSPPHLLPSPTKSFLPAKVVFAGRC